MPISDVHYLSTLTKQEAIDALPGENVVSEVLETIVLFMEEQDLLDKGYTQEEIDTAKAVFFPHIE
jgi:hypothetical protein